MKKVLTRQLEVDSRTILQNASLAIRDVYDAVVELVTNADDRYQILGCSGLIEIEKKSRIPRHDNLLKKLRLSLIHI